MAKLLVVKANPMDPTQSFGLQTVKAFVDSYKAANPSDTVTEIDLFNTDVPELNGDVFAAWGALGGGAEFTSLTPAQQANLSQRGALLTQFKDHDKVVFVTPLWNFAFPSRVKDYLDCLCVAGETFSYSEAGPKGLLTDKKAYHIHASGSAFGANNPADQHLKTIMNFIGISDYTTLLVEGHAAQQDQTEAILAKAIETATAAAKSF